MLFMALSPFCITPRLTGQIGDELARLGCVIFLFLFSFSLLYFGVVLLKCSDHKDLTHMRAKNRDEFNSPVRVLHLITGLNSGGAEMMLRKLLLGMDRDRFQNAVIALVDGGCHRDALLAAGIPVLTLGMRRGLPTLTAVISAAQFCKKFRPQIIQGWMYHAEILGYVMRLLSSTARSAAWIWNVRCANVDFSFYNPLTRWMVKCLARLSSRPNAVLVNSWAGLDHHRRLGYNPRRWIVVPNGFDTKAYAPNSSAGTWLRELCSLPSHVPLVVLVGRVDPMKDYANGLTALALVRKTIPDVRMLLVGQGGRQLWAPFVVLEAFDRDLLEH